MISYISIDNCYEDDGIVNLQGFLMGLNRDNDQERRDIAEASRKEAESGGASGGLRANVPYKTRYIVGILPEYVDGRLDRLNIIMDDNVPERLEWTSNMVVASVLNQIAKVFSGIRLEGYNKAIAADADHPVLLTHGGKHGFKTAE